MKLRIAAKVDRVDEAYFQREIAPLLEHPLVEYIGEIDESQKDEFIGNARALLFPIDWPEPFGLVMIEALACGTPVIAWRCGSVPEVIEHGRTGFIVDDIGQAIDAARRIGDIDRGACRRAFERRFTARRMAEHYIEVYAALGAAVERSEHAPRRAHVRVRADDTLPSGWPQRQRTMNERPIQIGGRWYVLATSAPAEEQPQALKRDELFALFDRYRRHRAVGGRRPGHLPRRTRATCRAWSCCWTACGPCT